MLKMEREEFYKLFEIVDSINNRDIPNCHIGYEHCKANNISIKKNSLYNLVKYINLLKAINQHLPTNEVLEIAKELKMNSIYRLYLEYKEEIGKNE